MPEAVLMSIHPQYAEAIFNGKKRFEFRKKRFRRNVSRMFVYSTSPISAVIGFANITGFVEGTPDEVWRICASQGAIRREDFFAYFDGCTSAIAICIDAAIRYDEAQTLAEFLPGARPPQSYLYVKSLSPELSALWDDALLMPA